MTVYSMTSVDVEYRNKSMLRKKNYYSGFEKKAVFFASYFFSQHSEYKIPPTLLDMSNVLQHKKQLAFPGPSIHILQP